MTDATKSEIAESGRQLAGYLFGVRRYTHDQGFVAIGLDRLFVYMQMPADKWAGERPDTWQGFPIEWRWDCGPVIAQVHEQALGVPPHD